MRRPFLAIGLPLLAAAASLANLVVFRLDHMMDPGMDGFTASVWSAALAAVVVLALGASFLLQRRVMSRTLGAIAGVILVLVIAAGLAPRVADVYVATEKAAADQAEGADIEMEFQNAYLDRSNDVETRIAAKSPYTPQEALDFLEFAADADLSWRSLPDHTPAAFALVEQAITGGILDPNGLTTSAPTADSPAVTVTLAFYDKRVRPSSPGPIARHDWDIIEILAAHGADVSGPDATALRADLAKTVVLGAGRFLELK